MTAAPPDPSWLTAQVELRALTRTVINRGDVRPESAREVTVPVSVAGTAVVTAIGALDGDTVAEGDRLMEISGRPVFVLEGPVPAYRTLRPGMSGADVSQLQAALARLGYSPDSDGVYGAATKESVIAFYGDRGYDPIPASLTEQSDRAAAEQGLRDADREVAVAQDALDDLSGEQASIDRAAAEAARDQAERDLNLATADRDSQVALAQQALEVALSARDLVAADPLATRAQFDEAQLEVNSARAELDQTIRLSDDAVATASETLWLTTMELNLVSAESDPSAARSALLRAIEARATAADLLADLMNESGPTIAQGEVVFVSGTPVRVEGGASTLGAVDGPGTGSPDSSAFVTLASGHLVVEMPLRPSDIGLVRVGMELEVLDEQTSTTYPARVSSIGPAAAGATATGASVLIEPTLALPDSMSGANVRVTITSASTEGASLVVPLAAVTSAANGSTNVLVLAAGREEPDIVAVTAGLSADGFVAVEPVQAGSLTAGDRVVVGR